MSGCYPNVVPEVCKHGVDQITHSCQFCVLEKNINTLYASLGNRINGLHEHKLYQIDENKKISIRVDELEKFHHDFKNVLKDDIEGHEELLDGFDKRIERLELKNIEHQIKRIADLERKFADFMQKSPLNCEKVQFKGEICCDCERLYIPCGC